MAFLETPSIENICNYNINESIYNKIAQLKINVKFLVAKYYSKHRTPLFKMGEGGEKYHNVRLDKVT